jgi:hypothetical protein
MAHSTGSARYRNFGANVTFTPTSVHQPANESELLAILDANRGKHIRAIGRLHSWSEAAKAEEVLIDLRLMNHVEVHAEGPEPWAAIGAGCQIKRVLSELARQGGYTLYSLGLITEQSIAGAVSTSTHGSGRHSTSNYVVGVRLALFDQETGQATIREISDGDELRAARCSLGSLGILTSVRVAIRKQYMVEEHFQRYRTLGEVLERESPYDLQQFYLIPWRWDFFAQHRRELSAPKSKLAWLYRLYWALGMDFGLHWAVWPLSKLLPAFCTKIFFRYLVPLTVPRCWKVVDRSDKQLTMEHELFRHIEIELFVTRSKLNGALEFVTWLLQTFSGDAASFPESLKRDEFAAELPGVLQDFRGIYVHHYPICVRKVLPDDTLISMSSGSHEPSYAISLISYCWPTQRMGFFQMSDILTICMVKLFGARAHWGKYCPHGHAEMPSLYGRFGDFAEVREKLDPAGVFSNEWARRIFGDSPSE